MYPWDILLCFDAHFCYNYHRVGPKLKKEYILCLADLHCPFVDVGLLNLILSLAKDVRVDHLFLLGDFVDFYGLSRFVNSPHRADDLQYEIDFGNEILSTICKGANRAHVTYIRGNHEERLIKYLNSHAKSLSKLKCLEFTELMNFSKHGIRYEPYAASIARGFIGTHGSRTGANPSQALLNNDFYGMNGMSGHNHRTSIFTKSAHDGTSFTWYSLGHLCSQAELDYATNLRWDQSFALITKIGESLTPEIIRCNHKGFYSLTTAKNYERKAK